MRLICRIIGHNWYVRMRDVHDLNNYVRHCKRCGLHEHVKLPPLQRVA